MYEWREKNELDGIQQCEEKNINNEPNGWVWECAEWKKKGKSEDEE